MRTSILSFNQRRAVELGLSVEDLLVLNWFVYFNGSDDALKFTLEDGIFTWVSYQKVLDDLPIIKCNKRNLARRFQHLVDAGVLVHKTLKQAGTMSVFKLGSEYNSLILDMNSSNSDEQSSKSTQGSLNLDDPVVQNRTNKDKILKNKYILPPKSPKVEERTNDSNTTLMERFEIFYKAYPKHKSRGAAEKAWKQLKPNDELLKKILYGLELAKQSADWKKDGGKYIPYPATWLRAKGWEDEYNLNCIENDSHERKDKGEYLC